MAKRYACLAVGVPIAATHPLADVRATFAELERRHTEELDAIVD